MFDELRKYKNTNHFFFTAEDELEKVCNAPKDASGIFIVNELKNGHIDLVYIGLSGEIPDTGGIYHRIVNGHQFGKTPRKKSWKQKLMDEKIDAIDVYWYDTTNDTIKDSPAHVKAEIMKQYIEINGQPPRWNIEIK